MLTIALAGIVYIDNWRNRFPQNHMETKIRQVNQLKTVLLTRAFRNLGCSSFFAAEIGKKIF